MENARRLVCSLHVRNISSPPLPAGTLCTWVSPDRPSFRLSLTLFPRSSGVLHTLCPLALVTCLTCSTGLDHTLSYIPALHLHSSEWHSLEHTYTHTHLHTHTFSFVQATAGIESVREQAAQPSGRLFTLPCAWRHSWWSASLSLELIGVAVKPSFARLKSAAGPLMFMNLHTGNNYLKITKLP